MVFGLAHVLLAIVLGIMLGWITAGLGLTHMMRIYYGLYNKRRNKHEDKKT